MESAQEKLLQHGLTLRSKWMERITNLARPGLEWQLILLDDIKSHYLNLLTVEEDSFHRIQALQKFSMNISEVPYLFTPFDEYAELQPNQGGAAQKEDTLEPTRYFSFKKLPLNQNADSTVSEDYVSPVYPPEFFKTPDTVPFANPETSTFVEATPNEDISFSAVPETLAMAAPLNAETSTSLEIATGTLDLVPPSGNDEKQKEDFEQMSFASKALTGDPLQKTALDTEAASFQTWFTKTPAAAKIIPVESTSLAYHAEETNIEHSDKADSLSPRFTFEPLKGLRQLGEWGQIHLSDPAQFDALAASKPTATTEAEPDNDIATKAKLSPKSDGFTPSIAALNPAVTPLSTPFYSENAPGVMNSFPTDFLPYNTQKELLTLHGTENLSEESKMPRVDELLEELQVRLNLEFNRYYTQ